MNAEADAPNDTVITQEPFAKRWARRMIGFPKAASSREAGLRLAIAFVVFMLMSRGAHANMIDDFKNDLGTATAGWMDRAFLVAKFGFVVVMGVGYTAHLVGVAERNNGSVDSWGRELLGYIRLVLPAYVLLLLFQPVVSTIVDKALALFGYVTGQVVTGPGAVIDAANGMLNTIWSAIGATGDLLLLPLVGVISSLLIYYIMARLAAELILVYARQFVVLSNLVMELAWGGAPGTANFASDVYSATRSTFYHAGIVVAIIAIGMAEVQKWTAIVNTPPDGNLIRAIVALVGNLILFFTIASGVTEYADSMLTGRAGVSGSRAVDGAVGTARSLALGR